MTAIAKQHRFLLSSIIFLFLNLTLVFLVEAQVSSGQPFGESSSVLALKDKDGNFLAGEVIHEDQSLKVTDENGESATENLFPYFDNPRSFPYKTLKCNEPTDSELEFVKKAAKEQCVEAAQERCDHDSRFIFPMPKLKAECLDPQKGGVRGRNPVKVRIDRLNLSTCTYNFLCVCACYSQDETEQSEDQDEKRTDGEASGDFSTTGHK